ncbi:hypothetical protein [Erythrobacter aureus]|uniref:Uncharacterized protein n=1 Tax=Erythrobacter aureus TaxID=2182384 RepID=A0A345YJD3_9SPHN|nr:hypothetical protein [Erythrobacter aureus]AXK44035.1 hypothetical protein DVR09_16410 [Erythrobacter aureus]
MRIKLAILALIAAILPTQAVAQAAPKPPPIYYAQPKPQQPAEQPRMTERQQEIMLIARNADGYITEDLHREFWDSIPFKDRQLVEFKALLADLVDRVIGPSAELGYETWHSADLSLRAGRVVRSENLDAAIEASLSASDIPSYREKAQESVASVDRILTAAAEGTPLQTAYGPMFINEDIIATTLAGIKGGTRRTELLFNPVWDPSPRLYKYPNAHVSILAPWALTPVSNTITLENGMVSDFHRLEQTVSDKQWAHVGFGDYSHGIQTGKVDLSDPSTAVLKNVRAGLKGVGATAISIPSAHKWRGYVSAEVSGSVDYEAEKAYVSLRSVYLPEHEGFLVFTTVSMISLADSQLLLDQLEANTQVLR